MPEAQSPPAFNDIAVALALAASKFRLDIEQMELVAARVGVSIMGTSLALTELNRNLDLIVAAHHFFRESASVEREMRAMILRKKNGRWGMFARAAVV
jgi:hypothetical protein